MSHRATTSRRSPILALVLLTGVAGAAACGGGDSASSSSSSSPEVAFHGKADLFPGFSSTTGLEPSGSPVQASFTLGASGAMSIDASATPSGSASAPKLTGLPGTGDLELHGGFSLEGELKVALPGLPAYDGPIPGIENIDIRIDGQQKFDPFAMATSASLHAAIPSKKLPPIPLPGGIAGNLVLTIAAGSFLELDLSGTCAGIDGGTATYVAHVDRRGTLIITPEIDIDFPGVAPVVLPNVAVDLALGASDLAMDAKVSAYASDAPKGEASTVACRGASGAGGSAATGSDGGNAGDGGAGASGPSSSSGAAGPGSSSSSGGDVQSCELVDDDLAGCNATHHCAYFICSKTCWEFGTQLDVGCGPPLTCDTSTALPDIRGDGGADVDLAQGNRTAWFKFKLDEASTGIDALAYTVTLDETAGAKYELYVYQGDASQAGCGATPTQGTGDPPSVITTIPDQAASDQSSFVSIEVRHVSGEPSANWLLTVQGNFAPSCQDDGVCTTADDCVCADCRTDSFCSDPANCNHDGVCDTYNEGCGCSDCSATPICH
jgi:hypothetical protein